MKSMFKAIVLVFCVSIAFQSATVLAQLTPEDLAKESAQACAASESVKPTPQMIIEKVNEAAALIEKEGTAAFPLFKGKDSKFIFAGTYIWVHDLAGIMRMHPMVYKLEGKSIIDLKDPNGKLFFTDMNEVVKAKGSGWVDYLWPKPGDKTPVPKISYVKMVRAGGEDLVVGCGVYDMSPEDMQKLLGK